MSVALPDSRYRGRFAPSPTGPLHAGSMLAALASWLFARQVQGQWLLRIEDLDPPREVAGAAAGHLQTLTMFGLQHDFEVASQSQRGPLYRDAIDQLMSRGMAFECHCSRAELAATDGIHRHCVSTARRSNPSIRLRVPDDCNIGFIDLLQGHSAQRVDIEVGDFVLRRADGLWAYQFAVVVDDAAQGITDVVRGADLLASTPRQILLQRALGLPTPRHAHLPLLVDSNGHKLSKSAAALPVDAGDPLSTLHALWRCLGQASLVDAQIRDPRKFLDAAVHAFQPALIPRQSLPVSAALHNAGAMTRD